MSSLDASQRRLPMCTPRYEELAQLNRGLNGGVSTIAFSSDGTYIATAGMQDIKVYISRVVDKEPPSYPYQLIFKWHNNDFEHGGAQSVAELGHLDLQDRQSSLRDR
ncbi:hypothetical protein C8Q76DRAFT_797979 [Earliella scabrosa]|nr:hypothetical protein C8Q76DRAFT_797979 [Earliella scabrosa]